MLGWCARLPQRICTCIVVILGWTRKFWPYIHPHLKAQFYVSFRLSAVEYERSKNRENRQAVYTLHEKCLHQPQRLQVGSWRARAVTRSPRSGEPSIIHGSASTSCSLHLECLARQEQECIQQSHLELEHSLLSGLGRKPKLQD